jgi:hypothetical protein
VLVEAVADTELLGQVELEILPRTGRPRGAP